MNTAQIKAYAPRARRDFIQAVTEKANQVGLSAENIEPVEIKGDVAIIAGRPFPKKVGELQKKLAERIQKDGFDQVMEAAAYTWFNRFAALRYMEIHNYLGHGFRVLSSRGNSNVPEILEEAANADLPGLDKKKVMELRLAGDKDNELYRILVLAQCNALNKSMPFLFEKIDSETELLLPDNLLHSNSPVRKLVEEIDEKQWNEVEIIGWIYQFYISERKNEVIGKVVKSKDIPAATQLFTPNWIVKYMVQNTLGRMWLATYPHSPLKGKMEYYIEPAEQEPEVQKQLNAITPKDLNPEEITFLDPASGSGHILVEAYNVFKEIYLERGYRTKDIPRLILEKNLYGLDIDDRAAQLACFAVLMKARRDDRRILSRDDLKLHVMAIQETSSFDTEALNRNLLKEKVIRFTGENELFPDFKGQMALRAVKRPEVSHDDVIELLELFHHGKTFGSLITIPESLAEKLPLFARLIEDKLQNGDMFERTAASKFKPVVEMAMTLVGKYDCVVVNPPYMGGKGMNSKLKDFAKFRFRDSKSDLFAMFIEHALDLSAKQRFVGMITMQSWMFLSSFEKFRESILSQKTILSMAHLGARAFDSIGGEVVSTTAFILANAHHPEYKGGYVRLVDGKSETEKKTELIHCIDQSKNTNQKSNLHLASAADFKKIPGSPIAYWVSESMMRPFEIGKNLGDETPIKSGMSTTDNSRFLRFWSEVSMDTIKVDVSSLDDAKYSGRKWFPFKKGGEFRRWYGNNDFVLNWKNDGEEIKATVVNNPNDPNTTHWSRRLFGVEYFFKTGITWTKISSSKFSARHHGIGHIFSDASNGCFPLHDRHVFLGFLNSKVADIYLLVLSPTLNFKSGDIAQLPVLILSNSTKAIIKQIIESIVRLSSIDWDFFETSWNFAGAPLQRPESHQPSLKATYNKLRSYWRNMTLEMQRLEEENNRIFIEAYGLQDELTPDVPLSEITLTCNPHYRYNGDKSEDDLEALLLADTIKELTSYSIGCMMGRYSLDHPGLIYAHSGNENFWEIYSHKKNKHSDNPSLRSGGEFQPDDDGIIPVMDIDWFEDDAAKRFIDFIKAAWPPEHLNENLKFIAGSLKPKNNEAPVDTIRRYLSTGFFKDHLKTYKKRPIYWLFSSGKQKAFECLVYLHRYNESTLPRMRSNYVTPLQGKFNARLDYLKTEKEALDTVSAKKKIQKEIDLSGVSP